jgi:small subunit ribosomal protein S18
VRTVPKRRSNSNPSDGLHALLTEGLERGGPLSEAEQRQVMDQQAPRASIQDMRGRDVTEAYMRQLPRRWRTGEVYAPKDLSPVEAKKFRQGKSPNKDVVDLFGFNPLDNYKVRVLALSIHDRGNEMAC